MDDVDLLILGCGFTGKRVAARFVARGARVMVTTRHPERLPSSEVEVVPLEEIGLHVSRGVMVLHSIPPEGRVDLLDMVGSAAARVVYLSSTAVYGAATEVDEQTPVDAGFSERAGLRLQEELKVAEGPWSTLVLRPAAIYGPGRGIQESMKRGSYSLSDTYVSRIYVDDLASHVEAALLSGVSGAYPVADDDPCTSREMAEYCARLLGVSLEAGAGHEQPSKFGSNRRVDGRAIRRLLGVTLQYPSYRAGVPAALQEAFNTTAD